MKFSVKSSTPIRKNFYKYSTKLLQVFPETKYIRFDENFCPLTIFLKSSVKSNSNFSILGSPVITQNRVVTDQYQCILDPEAVNVTMIIYIF